MNMKTLKRSLALHSSKHQQDSCIIFQVEIVGGVRRTVQPMGGTECYTQTDGCTHGAFNRKKIQQFQTGDIFDVKERFYWTNNKRQESFCVKKKNI